MNNRHLYWLTGLLTLIGLSIFLYKVFILHFPIQPDRLMTSWRLETRIDFVTQGNPVTARLFLPSSTAEKPVFNESFVAEGFGVTTRAIDDNRVATFSAANAEGKKTLFYRATAVLGDEVEESHASPPPKLKRTPMEEAEQAAARAILSQVRLRAAGPETMMALLMTALNHPQPGDEVTLMLGNRLLPRQIINAAVRILRFGGIPARRVNGLDLAEDRRHAPIAYWIEIYVGDRWLPFHGKNGAPGMPPHHVAWWRGERAPVNVIGGSDVKYTFSVSQAHQFALRSAIERGRAIGAELLDFSLLGLPFQTQQVYRILMVVPVGIFLLVILRNIIGVKTFGTFMPVLIAMAFRETHLLWGIILFSIVVFLGMAVRFYLEHLKLLLVPRLAAIVIIVIGVMALLSILSFKLGFIGGLSVALFPIVILSMTIERMTVVWDERGAKESLTQASGSLFVAILCYLVMNAPIVGHLSFVFPELLLVLLAGMLLLGRYTGYRLVELTRFRVLAGKEPS